MSGASIENRSHKSRSPAGVKRCLAIANASIHGDAIGPRLIRANSAFKKSMSKSL
jgi:hypothetical protein